MSPILPTLLLLSALLQGALSLKPVGLPEGAACRTPGGLIRPPIPCAARLVCVLTTFGNPAIDLPNGGTCRRLTTKPPACTVAFCASVGTSGICTISSQTATCAAWATRSDLGGVRPDCSFACTKECRFPRLVASDGSQHCTLCVLQAASCAAGFSFYGPVLTGPTKVPPSTLKPITNPPVTRPPPSIPEKCRPPIHLLDAATCCADYKIGCRPAGAACSTMGSRIGSVACVHDLKCVLTDFGFPAADWPNRGTCRAIRRARKCSVRFCARKGADTVCNFGSGCATCGAWATRSDGRLKPNCSFSCKRKCLPKHRWLWASDHSRHCSRCTLKRKSCLSGFTVYGPVRRL